MRIPTGMKTVQSSASINNLILYCCDKCGTYSLAENHVVGAGSKNYHVLQSDEKQATAYDKAKAAAMDSVSSAERLAAYTVNICCDYSGLTGLSGPVSCPHCGAVQPWSAWPKKWSTGLILLWIVMGFLLWVGLAVAVNNSVFLLPESFTRSNASGRSPS